MHKKGLKITITIYMDTTYNIRKIGGDKIALLGLFALALLVARVVVASKTAIILSRPIILAHTGLSVSMPAGNGWRSNGQWKYSENGFSLSSDFTVGPDNPSAWAYCQYLLVSRTTTIQMQFEQKASEVDGEIIKTDQRQAGALTFHWALIRKPQTALSFIFGTTVLPYKRQLDIEVHQVINDSEMAERTFERIVDSLDFEDKDLLKAGSEIIAKIRSRGLRGFSDSHNQRAVYLIKDSGMQNIGFTVDVFSNPEQDAQFDVRAAGIFYIKGKYASEQVTSFQSQDDLEEFVWKTETYSRTGRSSIEMLLEEFELITIRKHSEKTEARYSLSPAAIPEIFIEQLIGQMLDDNKNDIIVDVIEANGRIVPILVSEIENEEEIADEEVAYLFKLELLDGRGYFEYVYLNDQRQIYKRVMQQKETYVIESTTLEDVMQKFPERANYILQAEKMLR